MNKLFAYPGGKWPIRHLVVSAFPGHKTYVDVFEGLVEVEGLIPGSPHILLRPGFYSGVDPDRAPSEPRESSPNEGNGRDSGRESQNPGTQRNSGEQERPQTKPGGSEGKPD